MITISHRWRRLFWWTRKIHICDACGALAVRFGDVDVAYVRPVGHFTEAQASPRGYQRVYDSRCYEFVQGSYRVPATPGYTYPSEPSRAELFAAMEKPVSAKQLAKSPWPPRPKRAKKARP